MSNRQKRDRVKTADVPLNIGNGRWICGDEVFLTEPAAICFSKELSEVRKPSFNQLFGAAE
jgi:hypothetical protein